MTHGLNNFFDSRIIIERLKGVRIKTSHQVISFINQHSYR